MKVGPQKAKIRSKMPSYKISFQPVGRRGECRASESILECSRQLGLGVNSICGGAGTCCSCKVQVLEGAVSEPTANECEALSYQELKEGWRLACQTYPTSECTLDIPPESMSTPQRTQVEGLEVKVKPEPPVQAYRLSLLTPSLSNPQADADRLLEVLNRQNHLGCSQVDIGVLRDISPQLRTWNWQCQATVREGEVVAIGPWPSRHLGLAVDLGTTKIAGYLLDLNSGHSIAARGIMNPQISLGEDILSRISAAVSYKNQAIRLQHLAAQALNELASDLCAEVGTNISEIVEVVVVGNTAMHHILLGLPVSQLSLAPYVPAVSVKLDIKARDLGLHISPGAYVHLLPNIAGFVGADHVAALLATGALEFEVPTIVMDIGTNTEASLAYKGAITAVSCASGPAFEGGHIKDGMRASRGAIERVRITSDGIKYQTIDNDPPVGICGSGILDAMAQLYLAGIINKSGRMVDSHPRVRVSGKHREFVLASAEEKGGGSDVVVTQHDIRELQLAKAAIRTGIEILLEEKGCSESELGQVIIAGAFGSYIDVASAMTIGMLPSLPLDHFRQVGNAAGTGARMALVSLSQRYEAQKLASQVQYIELATAAGFNKTFLRTNYIG